MCTKQAKESASTSVAHKKLPQELWGDISLRLSTSQAISAAEVFQFSLSAYDRIWHTAFRSERWLASAGAEYANIVLVGVDLDALAYNRETPASTHLALVVSDPLGDCQYESDLFQFSVRGMRGTYKGPGQYQLQHLTLTVGSFEVPEILGRDFRSLFAQDGNQIRTKYCYWKDPERKIRALTSEDIRGIGGPVAEIERLGPIFLLDINPPIQRLPEYFPIFSKDRKTTEQFIFRGFGGESFHTGVPPLVHVIPGDVTDSGTLLFDGFTFRCARYEKYDRYLTDWVAVARDESGDRRAAVEARGRS